MARLATLTRRVSFLAFGLFLALGLIAPQAAGAMQPLPGSPAVNPNAAASAGIAIYHPPQFTKVHAWRSTGGIVDVQVEVTNTLDVVLNMQGTINLIDHQTYAWGDSYHFRVTGLTPHVTYLYEIDAIGGLTIAHANGSIVA